MNSFAPILLWCVLQVTVVSLAAGVCLLAVRRYGPVIRAIVASTSLGVIVLLSLLSISPWPNWRTALSSRPGGIAAHPLESAIVARPALESADGQPAIRAGENQGREATVWQTAQAFWDELQRAEQYQPASGAAAPAWRVWLTWLFAMGVGATGLRLLAGYLSARTYRTGSRLITEAGLLELLDVLRAEIGCAAEIEVRQSASLATAATLGWRHPVILLPVEWKQWSELQRRVVLAHELAHIVRRDYAAWICAQFCLLLHFYHPLVHWLVGRLRLDQELAADAIAAKLSGGCRDYLTILAEMALQQPDRPLGWPAQTFLPTRRTFLRRIEMLRDSRQSQASAPAGLRFATVTAVLLAAAFAVGLRGAGSIGPGQSFAQAPANSQDREAPSGRSPFNLQYVPRDALGIVAVRPAALIALPVAKPIAEALEQDNIVNDALGISIDKIEQAAVVLLHLDDSSAPHETTAAGMILRLSDSAAAQSVIDRLIANRVEVRYGPHTYFTNSTTGGRSTVACYQPNERTLIIGESDGYMRRIIAAGENGASQAPWASRWSEIAAKDLAVFVDVASVGRIVDRKFAAAPAEAKLSLAPFEPLWKNAQSLALSAEVSDAVVVSASASCADVESAERWSQTLAALATLGRNSLTQLRQVVSRDESPEALTMLHAIDDVDAMLSQVKVEQDGTSVQIKTNVDASAAFQIVRAAAPAIAASRAAAFRVHSINNLRQIGIALHNYHDANGNFPPAVVVGPDGKTPHSWRVEILPYLGHQELYDQYRMNEPWDSPSNKQLLAKIPTVLQHPADGASSTNSAYFALVGPGTVFSTSGGTRLADIIDGANNTILLVEAKRNIPWTKPEDISFNPAQPLADLGGYSDHIFTAAFCDGSVRPISQAVDKNLLRNLIQMNDRNPVNLP